MLKRHFKSMIAVSILALLCVLAGACARDKVGPEGPTEAEPVEILLHYTMRADLSPDYYYFTVFDFSDPNINDPTWETPKVSGDDRGKNWERYILFHGVPPTTSANDVYTLELQDLPLLVAVDRAPCDVIAVKLNDDEYTDLVTANKAANTVSVLLGAEGGVFITAVNYPTGNVPTRLITADYDGDEDADILVANFEDTDDGRSVSVLLNDGAGVLSDGGTISLAAQPSALAMADFTGDDIDDLAVALYTDSEAGNKVVVLPRTEEGFGDPVETAVGKNPVDFVVGDYNADEVNDLFVVNGFDGEGGNSVMVLTGNGDGSFAVAETLTTGNRPTSIAIDKLNADNVPDIVVTNGLDGEGGNSLTVFLSAEGGGYQVDGEQGQPKVIAVGHAPAKVLISDLNADSFLDFIVVESADITEGNRVRTLFGDAAGEYSSQAIAFTGREPLSAVLLDFNGDGFSDLAVANSFDGTNGNSVALLTGGEGGRFSGATPYWTDEQPYLLATEDWVREVNVGRNFIEVRLDAQLFTDPYGTVPERFLVDFLTATTGVDKESNPLDQGLELDWLLRPFLVSVQAGFNNDEERMNLETVENTPEPPPEAADIVDWWVEVT